MFMYTFRDICTHVRIYVRICIFTMVIYQHLLLAAIAGLLILPSGHY